MKKTVSRFVACMPPELSEQTTCMMEAVKKQCKQGILTIAEGVLLSEMIEKMESGDMAQLKGVIDQQFENWTLRNISPSDVSPALLRFATAGSLGKSIP